MNMKNIIVTRHVGLVEFLESRGIVGEVISHATPDNVRGCHVYGILPMHLASLAISVTVANLDLPSELRGKELTAVEMEKYFTGFSTYCVTEVIRD